MHSIRVSPHGSHSPVWVRADPTSAETVHIDPRVGPAGLVTPAQGAWRSGTAPAGERLEEAANGRTAP